MPGVEIAVRHSGRADCAPCFFSYHRSSTASDAPSGAPQLAPVSHVGSHLSLMATSASTPEPIGSSPAPFLCGKDASGDGAEAEISAARLTQWKPPHRAGTPIAGRATRETRSLNIGRMSSLCVAFVKVPKAGLILTSIKCACMCSVTTRSQAKSSKWSRQAVPGASAWHGGDVARWSAYAGHLTRANDGDSVRRREEILRKGISACTGGEDRDELCRVLARSDGCDPRRDVHRAMRVEVGGKVQTVCGAQERVCLRRGALLACSPLDLVKRAHEVRLGFPLGLNKLVGDVCSPVGRFAIVPARPRP
eukprot:scaffold86123_cov32-Tisochrysis_lutea.AAC.2